MSGANAIFYVNGQVGTTAVLPTLRGVTRTSNFVGRSNVLNSDNVNVLYDELKIFNRSLTQSEILMVLNSYY